MGRLEAEVYGGRYGVCGEEGVGEVEESIGPAVDVSQSITQNQANAGLGEISDLNQGGDDVGAFLVYEERARTYATGRGILRDPGL